MKYLNTLLQLLFLVTAGAVTGYAQVSITCPSFFETVVDTDPGQCSASLVDYEVTATSGGTKDLPAFYPLFDDLADELGNANDGFVFGTANAPSPGNPICIPPGSFFLDRFSTPAFPNSFDGNAFKFSVEFKLNGYGANNITGNPILVMSSSWRWIGLFTFSDGRIGIQYLNSNYVPSTTTVNLDQWYKAELVFDNGTAYLYLDDVLIQTVVTGPLAYPGFFSLADQPNTSQLLTGNGSTGLALNGCIRNVRVANLNDDGDSEPEGITITDNAPDEFPLGYTYVTATATSESGSSASCSFYVQVVDNEAPEAVCKNSTVQIQSGGSAFLNYNDLLDLNQTTDNCGSFFVPSQSQFYVYCDDVGNTIPVSVVVSDYYGNTGTCTSMITVEDGNGLPAGWSNADIGTADGDIDKTICSADDTWVIESNGPSFGFQDKLHYAWTNMCGDGEITTQVLSVTNNGWAGIMFRQSSDAGSPMVRLKTQLSNYVRREVRTSYYGFPNSQQLFAPMRNWLRIVKQGNTYTGYTSPNGSNWYFAFSVNVNLGSCPQVGLMAEGINQTSTAVATFDNVNVYGSNPTIELPDDGLQVENALTSGAPDLNVFPNPASGEVSVELNNFEQEDLSLILVNSLGQTIRQEKLQGVDFSLHTINLSNVEPGVYFVRLERPDGEMISKRLIVQ